MLGADTLSVRQQRVDERVRTLCLVVMSVAVVGIGLYYLRTILIRFVLALALHYLLTPVIDLLSCRRVASCKCKLPHGAAVLLALLLAAGLLAVVTVVVARSIGSFAAHAEQYSGRAQELLDHLLNATARFDLLGPEISQNSTRTDMQHAIAELAKSHLNLTSLIVDLLGTAAHAIENVIYILLFLAFLLASGAPRDTDGGTLNAHEEAMCAAHARASPLPLRRPLREPACSRVARSYLYIRGKVLIVLLVAVCDGIILWALRIDLWHVFAIATFWLQFVPNVGLAVSLILPLPLVVLDPHFGTLGSAPRRESRRASSLRRALAQARASCAPCHAVAVALAFFGPLGVGLVAKDVLEPMLLGHSTSLTPVAVLLSVLLWGSVWGLTGMVLAVPLTAVLRIHLESLEHPLARWAALKLAGRDAESGGGKGAVAPI